MTDTQPQPEPTPAAQPETPETVEEEAVSAFEPGPTGDMNVNLAGIPTREESD